MRKTLRSWDLASPATLCMLNQIHLMPKFRETLWFKKGVPAPGLPDAGLPEADLPDADPPDAGLPGSDLPDAPAIDSLRPLEDRYTDDGSLTEADIEEFSLNAPATTPSTPKTKR